MTPPRRRSGRPLHPALATAGALAVTWLPLVVPLGSPQLSAAQVLRIPIEGIAVVALLLAVPAAAARTARAIAWTAGTVLGVVVLLELADAGAYRVFDRPAHPLTDWALVSSLLDYVAQAEGRAASVAVAAAVAVGALALLVLTAASLARVATVARGRRPAAARGLAVLAAAWTGFALLGTQITPAAPVAAHTVAATALDQVDRARVDLANRTEFATVLAEDRSGRPSDGGLLAGLHGKDVVVAFVESYGRTALQDPAIAPGVDAVLDAGSRDLAAAGFSARSGYLTSPTFGGGSWLAHSTLLSGAWVDNQSRYRQLMASDHTSLVSDFRHAGWRTTATLPGTGKAWPEGAFYGYDQVYLGPSLGYSGPAFSWSPMPDQFALSRFDRLSLAHPPDTPVMATIELTSSHSPWAPLPRIVPWQDLGDGSVFDPMPGEGRPPADAATDRAGVRADYARAVRYSLETLLSFLARYGTQDTVLIFLGDHQPAAIVTGEGASRDVPVAVVAKDPDVLEQISSWGWTDGVRPAPDAPVWPMSGFRQRFLSAFTPAAP
jgi:hypothetical protein